MNRSILFVALTAQLLISANAIAQTDPCQPAAKRDGFECIDRVGHCVEVFVDGQTPALLTDPATKSRLAKMGLKEVCWQLAKPVSLNFRASGRSGGLKPGYVGSVEQVSVQLYAIEDFDPKLDKNLRPLHQISTEADGYRNGTWQLRSEHTLPPGEYVASIRVTGSKNWDGKRILLKLDAASTPVEANPGTRD
jgi:hypothetical protein